MDETPALQYVTARLQTMVDHGWIAGDRDALLVDVGLVLASLAQARAMLAQAQRATEAERRARELAEMRLYAYGDHQPHCPQHAGLRGGCVCGYEQLLARPPALLAELDAARAVVAVARAWSDEPAMHAVLEAYDAVASKEG